MMEKLFQLIQKSETSKKHLWLLNRIMNHTVRFNKPHGFQVIKIAPDFVQTFAPYHKKNFNHLHGIHACAIATVGELAAGLLLMNHFSPKDYRVIMSTIAIDYHYQAKKDIVATATLSANEKENSLQRLNAESKTTQTIISEIKDNDQQLVATVQSTWQIKSWCDVKTRL
jgi:acyl-coenzyme A thioesterase PaaI-like protein